MKMKTVMDKFDLVEVRRAIDDFQDFADVAVGEFPCHLQDRGLPCARADLKSPLCQRKRYRRVCRCQAFGRVRWGVNSA
jgi:hypothetical protein